MARVAKRADALLLRAVPKKQYQIANGGMEKWGKCVALRSKSKTTQANIVAFSPALEFSGIDKKSAKPLDQFVEILETHRRGHLKKRFLMSSCVASSLFRVPQKNRFDGSSWSSAARAVAATQTVGPICLQQKALQSFQGAGHL
jgi:hypothetical protein